MESLLALLFLSLAFVIIFRTSIQIIQDPKKISTKKQKQHEPSKKTSNYSSVSFYSAQKIWKELNSTELYISSSKELNSAEEVAIIASTTACRVFRRMQEAHPPKYTLKTLSLLEVIKYFNTRFNGYHVLPEMKHKLAMLISKAHKEMASTQNKITTVKASQAKQKPTVSRKTLYTPPQNDSEPLVLYSDTYCYIKELTEHIPNFQISSLQLSKWKRFLNTKTQRGFTWGERAENEMYFDDGKGIVQLYNTFSASLKQATVKTHPTPSPRLLPSPPPPSKKITFDGYVYCFSNNAMPHLLKIGFTTRNPYERAKELTAQGGTALPGEYDVEFYYQCNHPQHVEQKIHKILDDRRYNQDREFFQLSIQEAKKTFARHVPEPRRSFA